MAAGQREGDSETDHLPESVELGASSATESSEVVKTGDFICVCP